jgi:DNA-directed RNA polymerase subunit M/transcription elongation factor TFIIS
MPKYCPECGGELLYDLSTKLYMCKSCGSTYNQQELIDAWKKMRRQLSEGDGKEKLQREYLKWWLSRKES